jgi:TPR repeat protein
MKKFLLVLSTVLLLQGCASSSMGEQFVAGKQQFNAGNYKGAFHQLLPVAVYGNKEAQYAVGYMYYYGVGTAQDEESGEFWMHKSAEQHYAPAENALKVIGKK